MSWRHVYESSGFSLIEVVVALAIVALSLGTVLQLVNGAMLSVNHAESYLYALGAANSRLAVMSANNELRPGNSHGSADGVTWQISVQPFPAPRPSLSTMLYWIHITTEYRGSRVQTSTLLIAAAPK